MTFKFVLDICFYEVQTNIWATLKIDSNKCFLNLKDLQTLQTYLLLYVL